MEKICATICLRALKAADISTLDRISDGTDFRFTNALPSDGSMAPPASPLDHPLTPETVIGFAIMEESRLVGQVVLATIDLNRGSCTMTMGIAQKSDRSRGIGSCALIMALRYAFLSLGMQQVLIDTLSSNLAARHCLEKVGFSPSGIEKNVFPSEKGFVDRHHYVMTGPRFMALYPPGR